MISHLFSLLHIWCVCSQLRSFLHECLVGLRCSFPRECPNELSRLKNVLIRDEMSLEKRRAYPDPCESGRCEKWCSAELLFPHVLILCWLSKTGAWSEAGTLIWNPVFVHVQNSREVLGEMSGRKISWGCCSPRVTQSLCSQTGMLALSLPKEIYFKKNLFLKLFSFQLRIQAFLQLIHLRAVFCWLKGEQ